jgi:integrase
MQRYARKNEGVNYPGKRLGNVLALRWAAYDAEALEIAVRQAKTAEDLIIPVHETLRIALDAEPRRAAEICTRPDGAAWKLDHFKHTFAKERARRGLPDDLHFHGLRHSAAVRLAEGGCSAQQIQAILGHRTLTMVTHYTQKVNRRRLAKEAMPRFDRDQSG